MSQTEVQLIKDGVIVNADLHSSANISASKLLRPIDLSDSEKIRFGTGNDFEIFHDGTKSRIHSASHAISIRSGGIFGVFNADGTEEMILATPNGSVELYHNDVKTFETTAEGNTIRSIGTSKEMLKFISNTGATAGERNLTISSPTADNTSSPYTISTVNSLAFQIDSGVDFLIHTDGNLKIPNDTGRFIFGASDDLLIYHDGSHNYILSPNAHPLIQESDEIQLRAVNNELYFKAEVDGAVNLYNNNALRFQTTTAGADILRSDAAVVFKVESTSNDASHDSIIRMKVANASADCHIQFADPDDDDVGQIMYDHSINAIRFFLNTSEEYRFEADGDFHADGDVIAASTTISSDLKLKENIEVVSNPIEKVEALRGVTFDWKRDGKKSAGVIAQDVEKVLPQAVKETKGLHDAEPYKTVNYHALTSILIEAIKELSARVKELEAK